MTETLLINVKQQTMSSASNFILNQINFSPGIVDTMKREFLLALFCATLAQGGRVQHHLRCWAINGWVDREGMDQWCMDNCLNNPPYCPSTTGDGGGCDMIVVWPASINITLIAINHVNCPEVIQTPRTSLGVAQDQTPEV